MARSVTRRTGGRAEHAVIHPRREWLIGLGVCLLIVVVTGVVSARQFIYYDTFDENITPQKIPVQQYDAATAATAISIFEAKQAAFDVLVNRSQVAPAPVVEEQSVASSTPDEADPSTETETDVVEEVAPQPATNTRPIAS